jgi:hypothetical protein
VRTRNARRCARGLGLALVLAVLGAGSAAADSIAYFNGPGGIGFANSGGVIPALDVRSQLSIPGLVFKQKIKKVKFKDGVYTVRVKLKVKNQTGSTLDDLVLLITALAQPTFVAPDTPILLDLGGKKITDLTIAQLQGSPERFFAAFDVGRLRNKKKFKAQIEYQVIGDLQTGRASTLQYTIGTAPVPVPEPGTALLLGGGLVLLAAGRRSLLETAHR